MDSNTVTITIISVKLICSYFNETKIGIYE
jgi:hypothetical protein